MCEYFFLLSDVDISVPGTPDRPQRARSVKSALELLGITPKKEKPDEGYEQPEVKRRKLGKEIGDEDDGAELVQEQTEQKRRGRPRKYPSTETNKGSTSPEPETGQEDIQSEEVKRKRGRQRKHTENDDDVVEVVVEKRGRGRPRKHSEKLEIDLTEEEENDQGEEKGEQKRGRGRPRKHPEKNDDEPTGPLQEEELTNENRKKGSSGRISEESKDREANPTRRPSTRSGGGPVEKGDEKHAGSKSPKAPTRDETSPKILRRTRSQDVPPPEGTPGSPSGRSTRNTPAVISTPSASPVAARTTRNTSTSGAPVRNEGSNVPSTKSEATPARRSTRQTSASGGQSQDSSGVAMTTEDETTEAVTAGSMSDTDSSTPVKRGRGRPPKTPKGKTTEEEISVNEVTSQSQITETEKGSSSHSGSLLKAVSVEGTNIVQITRTPDKSSASKVSPVKTPEKITGNKTSPLIMKRSRGTPQKSPRADTTEQSSPQQPGSSTDQGEQNSDNVVVLSLDDLVETTVEAVVEVAERDEESRIACEALSELAGGIPQKNQKEAVESQDKEKCRYSITVDLQVVIKLHNLS